MRRHSSFKLSVSWQLVPPPPPGRMAAGMRVSVVWSVLLGLVPMPTRFLGLLTGWRHAQDLDLAEDAFGNFTSVPDW